MTMRKAASAQKVDPRIPLIRREDIRRRKELCTGYLTITEALWNSAEFRALHFTAAVRLIDLMCFHSGRNNGSIFCSSRMSKDRLQLRYETIKKADEALVKARFLTFTGTIARPYEAHKIYTPTYRINCLLLPDKNGHYYDSGEWRTDGLKTPMGENPLTIPIAFFFSDAWLSLSCGAKMALLITLRAAKGCVWSYFKVPMETIMERCDCSMRTAQRYMKELCKKHLIAPFGKTKDRLWLLNASANMIVESW